MRDIAVVAIVLAGAMVAVAQSALAQERPFDHNSLFNAFPDRDDYEPLLALPLIVPYDPETEALDLPPEFLYRFRTKTEATLDTIYDAGLFGSGTTFRPAAIVLDATPESRGRGRFQMTGTGTVVEFDAGAPAAQLAPSGFSSFDFVEEFAPLDAPSGEIRLRHAFGAFNLAPNVRVLAGQTFTTFGDSLTLPFSLVVDGTPAGAVFRRQPQIRATRTFDGGWHATVAIEQPTATDFVLPDPAGGNDPQRNVRLQRYPDAVGRVQWIRPTGDRYEIDRFHVASLVRAIGFKDAAGDAHYVTGWGVAAAARSRLTELANVQLGAVAGEGLGDYLFGFAGGSSVSRTAAGPDADNRLTAVRQLGTYIGYQQSLTPRLAANVAYGYALADTTPEMSAVARMTHNAWTNFVFQINANVHVGLEYQYGFLRLTDGSQGSNSRMQMAMTLR